MTVNELREDVKTASTADLRDFLRFAALNRNALKPEARADLETREAIVRAEYTKRWTEAK